MFITTRFWCPTVLGSDGPLCLLAIGDGPTDPPAPDIALAPTFCPSEVSFTRSISESESPARFVREARLYAMTNGWVSVADLPGHADNRVPVIGVPLMDGRGGPWLICPTCVQADMHVGGPRLRSAVHPLDECDACQRWARRRAFHSPGSCATCDDWVALQQRRSA